MATKAKTWKESKSEAMETARILFDLAFLAFDIGAEEIGFKLQADARSLEKHYTYDRKWAGNNGGR